MSRREVALWIIGCLLANHALKSINTGSLDGFLFSVASFNIIFAFACFVIVWRLWQSSSSIEATTADLAAAFGAGVALVGASLIGATFAAGVVSTAAALYLLLAHKQDAALRAASFVLLALSAHQLWGPIVFRLFTSEILQVDATLVGHLLSWIRPDIAWNSTTFKSAAGHTVALVGACSSFNNVSIALLAYTATVMSFRTGWTRQDTIWILIVSAVMIAINVLRLCILASSLAAHRYWHDGDGSAILAFVQTMVIVVLCYAGAKRSGQSP